MGVGIAVPKWPSFVQPQRWPLMEGVVNCVLAAMSILALLGVRYPLQMLPLLLFESAWKLIWLSVVALPLWTADRMDPAMQEVAFSCLFVVIILAVIPWPYVYAHYVTKRGERWRAAPSRPAHGHRRHAPGGSALSVLVRSNGPARRRSRVRCSQACCKPLISQVARSSRPAHPSSSRSSPGRAPSAPSAPWRTASPA
jgi:hypothetical protein